MQQRFYIVYTHYGYKIIPRISMEEWYNSAVSSASNAESEQLHERNYNAFSYYHHWHFEIV